MRCGVSSSNDRCLIKPRTVIGVFRNAVTIYILPSLGIIEEPTTPSFLYFRFDLFKRLIREIRITLDCMRDLGIHLAAMEHRVFSFFLIT